MRLVILSNRFYEAHKEHAEILKKKTRPYVCLSVKIGNTVFAIPFRHHISHKYAFITTGRQGLDYTKAVVIYDKSFIVQGASPQIEQKDFNAIKGKEGVICKGLENYIKLYKKAMQEADNEFYSNVRRCSSLQYFEDMINMPL